MGGVADLLEWVKQQEATRQSQTSADAKEPPRFSGADPRTAFIADAMKAYATRNYGMGAELAGSFINYWAERYKTQTGEWPTQLDDSFHVGALSLVPTAQLPTFFTRNGTTYGMINPKTGERYLYPVPLTESDISDYEVLRPDLDPADRVLMQRFGLPLVRRTPTFEDLPELTDDDFLAIIQANTPKGPGRRGPVFDTAQLAEAVTNGWRHYLIDTPGNPDEIAADYVAEATAFASRGGNLDFQTWLLNTIRETDRYKTLYQRKPAELTEDDFIAQYRGTAESFGLDTTRTAGYIEQGMAAGASASGFRERLQNERAVQVNDSGFGRQVANLANQLKVMS